SPVVYERLIRIEDDELDSGEHTNEQSSAIITVNSESEELVKTRQLTYLQAKSPFMKLYYRIRDKYHQTPDKLKYASLATLAVQNATLNLTMRAARTQKDQFSASTAVIVSEVLKFFSCLFMISREQSYSLSDTVYTIERYIIRNPSDTLKVAVPSIVYYIQNNLIYIGSYHLDAATSQVTYQLKILTTAVFSVFMLGKRLSGLQWIALLLLFIGVAIVEVVIVGPVASKSGLMNSHAISNQTNVEHPPEDQPDGDRHENPLIGFLALIAASCLSGFAGVYFEKILKSTAQVSLWIRNIQLSIVAIPVGLLQVYILEPTHVEEKGFFFGYTAITWICIILQAQGGLLVAVVVKYANNILKGFATSLAIIISSVASVFLFNFTITVPFFIGTSLVIASIMLYSRPSIFSREEAAQLIMALSRSSSEISRSSSPLSSNRYASFMSAKSKFSDTDSMFTCVEDSILDVSDGKEVSPHFEVYWRDLNYEISTRTSLTDHAVKNILGRSQKKPYERTFWPQRRTLKILSQLNGSIKSGHLTAIMGPSGAGKSTLLNCLTRHRHTGYSGVLGVVQSTERKLVICTIPQNDYLTEYLTVYQALSFASRFKNPKYSCDEHDDTVRQIADSLDINQILNTKIKKLSGGQRKRVSVAQELVSRPDILILDEPTSGLDSVTCYRVINMLSDLAKRSRSNMIKPIAIVITVHQPQREVFDLFDRVYTIANGGRVIYNGSPQKCMDYLVTNSGIEPSSDKAIEYENPATFMIEIACGEYGSEPIEKLAAQNRQEFIAHLDDLLVSKENLTFSSGKTLSVSKKVLLKTKMQQKFDVLGSLKVNTLLLRGSDLAQTHSWDKLSLIVKRQWIESWNDPMQILARLFIYVLIALSMKFAYGPEPVKARACPIHKREINLVELVDSGERSVATQQEELALTLEYLTFLFSYIFSGSVLTACSTNLSFTLAIKGILRETRNGYFNLDTYMLGKTIADIPLELGLPIVAMLIACPLPPDIEDFYWRLGMMCLAVSIANLAVQNIGVITSILFVGNVQTSLIVSESILITSVVLSGFILRLKYMPYLLLVLSHISIYRMSSESFLLSRYGFGVCGECDPAQFNSSQITIVGIPNELRQFSKYWLDTLGTDSEETEYIESNSTQLITTTATAITSVEPSNGDADLFEIFGQQIALSLSYGVELKSCQDMKPYQLHVSNINDVDLSRCILTLTAIVIFTRLFIWLLVRVRLKSR
ncbi:UDP-galactose translocator, partial [Fragariocoptes setiger]